MEQLHNIYNRILDRTLSILNDSRSKLLIKGKLENIVFSPEENICAGLYVNNPLIYNMNDLEIEKSYRYNRSMLHTGTLINHTFIYNEDDVLEMDDLIGDYLGEDRFETDAMDILMYRICNIIELRKSSLLKIACGDNFLVYPSSSVNFEFRRKVASLTHLSIIEYFERVNKN